MLAPFNGNAAVSSRALASSRFKLFDARRQNHVALNRPYAARPRGIRVGTMVCPRSWARLTSPICRHQVRALGIADPPGGSLIVDNLGAQLRLLRGVNGYVMAPGNGDGLPSGWPLCFSIASVKCRRGRNRWPEFLPEGRRRRSGATGEDALEGIGQALAGRTCVSDLTGAVPISANGRNRYPRRYIWKLGHSKEKLWQKAITSRSDFTLGINQSRRLAPPMGGPVRSFDLLKAQELR